MLGETSLSRCSAGHQADAREQTCLDRKRFEEPSFKLRQSTFGTVAPIEEKVSLPEWHQLSNSLLSPADRNHSGTMTGLTYAIGDVHGCKVELDRLLDLINDHAAGRTHKLVFLGDYIDKGPDSAGVIGTLMELQRRDPDGVVFIKGNHDNLMLRAARGDPAALAKWMTMDGASVLFQYRVERAEQLPDAVLDWVVAMPTWHSDGLRYFVHAGVDPHLPLSYQTETIHLSMRGAFLESDFDFGEHVVHGHTPQFNGLPDLRPFRTNLDTGVVQTGCLTAAVFEPISGPPSTIIATRPSGEIVITQLKGKASQFSSTQG